jgi:hypothetical protein
MTIRQRNGKLELRSWGVGEAKVMLWGIRISDLKERDTNLRLDGTEIQISDSRERYESDLRDTGILDSEKSTFVNIETKVTIKNVRTAVRATFPNSWEHGFVKLYFSRQAEEVVFLEGKG